MINGAHVVLYSTAPEEDRAFLRDALQLPWVDVGEGWLILALPPSEIAVHPSDRNERPELFLMVDDVDAFLQRMREMGAPCEPVQDRDYGRVSVITLPGGGSLGVYQPHHARPVWSED